jgi:hypothetical protein
MTESTFVEVTGLGTATTTPGEQAVRAAITVRWELT